MSGGSGQIKSSITFGAGGQIVIRLTGPSDPKDQDAQKRFSALRAQLAKMEGLQTDTLIDVEGVAPDPIDTLCPCRIKFPVPQGS